MKNLAFRHILSILIIVFSFAFLTTSVIAGEYAALKGVNGVNTVFDVSQSHKGRSFWQF